MPSDAELKTSLGGKARSVKRDGWPRNLIARVTYCAWVNLDTAVAGAVKQNVEQPLTVHVNVNRCRLLPSAAAFPLIEESRQPCILLRLHNAFATLEQEC